jgi:ArsR family transcriptional regulator
MDIFERKSEILKALAQPVRLRIIEILRDGEKCVCEMIPLLGEEQANTSKHLSILRQAGIVEYRKEGVSSYYRIKDKKIFRILDSVEDIVKSELLNSAKLAEEMGIKER